MNKPTHEKIYLAPENGIYCWSTTPAPGAQHESNDAVEYVRGDLFDALAAQNKILLDALNLALPSVETCYKQDMATWETLFLLREAVKAAPQQCLLHIEAEAGRKGYLKAIEDWAMICASDEELVSSDANEYAESVRQGGE